DARAGGVKRDGRGGRRTTVALCAASPGGDQNQTEKSKHAVAKQAHGCKNIMCRTNRADAPFGALTPDGARGTKRGTPLRQARGSGKKRMGTRLYVGNLPYSTDDKQLRALFEEIGHPPREVRIITDRMTGQSRGFAFVEVADQTAVQAAISSLNGRPFGGRTLTVNEARERESRPPGSA